MHKTQKKFLQLNTEPFAHQKKHLKKIGQIRASYICNGIHFSIFVAV